MNKPTPLERRYLAAIVAVRQGVLGEGLHDTGNLKPVWADDYQAVRFPFHNPLWFPVTQEDYARARHEAFCVLLNWPVPSPIRN